MNYLQELLLPSPLRQARRIYRRFVREYEREVATLGGVLIRLEKRYAARGGLSTDRLVGRLDRLAAEAVTVARHDLEIFATEGERIASRRLEFVNDVNSLLEQIEQAFSVIDGEELIEE
jgi:hypothetical protein